MKTINQFIADSKLLDNRTRSRLLSSMVHLVEMLEGALVEDGKVIIRGLGTFEVKKRNQAFSGFLGDGSRVEEMNIITFRPARRLKKAVNAGKYS